MAKKKSDNKREKSAVAPAPESAKIEFDIWYAMREASIPGHHHKEILKADFKGRGLENWETIEVFDKALQKYGVSL